MERNVLLEVRVSEHCIQTISMTLANFVVVEYHRRHRYSYSHFYFQFPLSHGLSVSCVTEPFTLQQLHVFLWSFLFETRVIAWSFSDVWNVTIYKMLLTTFYITITTCFHGHFY